MMKHMFRQIHNNSTIMWTIFYEENFFYVQNEKFCVETKRNEW